MANINFLNGQAITGNVTIATSGVTDNLILTSTDTSSASAPDIVLYRNAAIADSDTLGVVEYKGKNGMVPSSGTPLTYNAIYSRIADASNNQSILTLSANKGNGSGAFIHAVNVSAIGTNNSATGAILINPLSDFELPAYNLDVNGTAYISNTLLINGELSLDNIANASTDTDKFVVADNGVIKYRTGAQVRSDIGAGTGSGSVTSIATTSPIQGGTITGSGTISITTATASAIGAGNVNVNGAGTYDGLRLSYSGGTATVGLDPESLPNYTGTPGSADTGSLSMILHNNDDVNNINQLLEIGQLQTMINTNNYLSSASFSTGNGVLTLNRSGLSAVTVDLDGRYALSSNVPTVYNSTITIQAGTNLTTGGDFTTNQSSNETITINMATGGVGAGTYGSTSNSTKIDNITVDAYGRVTGVTTGATGQVNQINSGNLSTISVASGTTSTISTITAAVSSNSFNLATGSQIQSAIDTAVTGVLKFDGTWNASTNSPSLSSGTGTSGDYYIVSVAGSTNLDGITDWAIGDWAVFANTTWTKIDNSQVGNVTGSGSSGRVAFWNSASNITSDSQMTWNSVSDVLTVNGNTSDQWSDAYDNKITGFTDSGSSTITLTLTQQDGGSLTTSFSNPQGTVTSVGTTGSVNGITLTGTVTSSGNLTLGGTLSINNSDWSGTDLSVANGGTGASSAAAARTNLGVINDTGTPAILSNGSTPTLNTGIAAAEVRTLIGAGTSSSSGVTSVATTNGITGGTITGSGTIQLDSTVVRTSGTQTIAGAKTFSNDLTMANTADLKFVDTAGTFPTSGKGFDWTLNNDGARIYAIQPSSDSIDLTFELRDNATTNDRFVFFVNDYQGSAFDKYPLIIKGGTISDFVDSAIYTAGTIRLSNSGVLSNVTNTNWDAAYNDKINSLAVTGTTTKTLTATQQDGGTLTASWTDDSGSNNYVSSASFNTSNGVLTLNRSGLSAVTVDLDGRYVTSSGVTSVATGNGLTGGTITGTGTVSVDYSTGSDNLIFSANAWGSSISTAPYTPYILMADSNPGIANDQVEKVQIEDIPMNRFGKPDSSIDMDTNKIINLETPTNSNDAANKQYVDDNAGSTPGNGQIDGRTAGLGLSGSMDATANQTGNTTFTVTSNASTSDAANTIAYRNSSADIAARLFRATYANQSTISGAIAFRVNNSTDNYTRYCSSPSAIRAFIGAGTGSGTVTGTGASGRVAFWNSSTGITSEADFLWSGQTLQLGGSANASEYTIELGKGRTNNGYAYIDLVGDATYSDYGLRIIRGNGGANTSSEIIHRGTSNFTITNQENASFKIQTSGANERFKIRGNGETYFGPDGASTSTLYIDPVGRKVGFRTETPGSAFDVNGTFRARNELNIGATTEQNFFVSGSSPYYVKMGNYTPSNAGNYMGGETNVGLLRSTAGFGTTGKVLMATRLYTTKIETGGWPTSTGSSNGVNVTPTPDNDQVLIVKNIFVHKAGSTIGQGWSTSTYPVEFVQQQQNGVYAILGGVARTVIINGSGAWYYNAHQLYGLSNPQNEALGGLGAPVKLMLNSTLSTQPTWYITVEYSLIDLDIFRNNVDQTLT